MPIEFCVPSNCRPKLFLPEYVTEKPLNSIGAFSQQLLPFLLEFFTNTN